MKITKKKKTKKGELKQQPSLFLANTKLLQSPKKVKLGTPCTLLWFKNENTARIDVLDSIIECDCLLELEHIGSSGTRIYWHVASACWRFGHVHAAVAAGEGSQL